MRKIIFITLHVFIFFFLEYFLFNLVGPWIVPNLLLLLVIFINLCFGIRYSLYTAVVAGLLEDSFSAITFGTSIFSFVVCAYLTTVLKKYIFHTGSLFSRLLLICIVNVSCLSIHYLIAVLYANIGVLEFLKFVFFPEMIMTLFLANLVFNYLKKCVLKY